MKLNDFLRLTGMSARQFAKGIGVTPQSMSRYLHHGRVPRSQVMQRIYTVTQGAVTPNDFYPASGSSLPGAGNLVVSATPAAPTIFYAKDGTNG